MRLAYSSRLTVCAGFGPRSPAFRLSFGSSPTTSSRYRHSDREKKEKAAKSRLLKKHKILVFPVFGKKNPMTPSTSTSLPLAPENNRQHKHRHRQQQYIHTEHGQTESGNKTPKAYINQSSTRHESGPTKNGNQTPDTNNVVHATQVPTNSKRQTNA